jgi:hypothetical protein
MTTDDYIKSIEESLKLPIRTEFLNRNYRQEAVTIVNTIITNSIYNNSQTINVSDVEFTDYTFGAKKIVTDRTETTDQNGDTLTEVQFGSNYKISQILFDIYYPKANEESYYHYTKISALRHILKGQLKLKPLISNENYGEFRTFYEDHNILGYLKHKDYDRTLMKDALIKEIYVFCMASKVDLKKKNEDSLWHSFADDGHGVRIEFEVKTQHPDFRKIFYKDKYFDKRDLVINRIQAITQNLYEREFYIAGISKIGSFYLPGEYKIENEVRFVLKKHTDEYDFKYNDDKGYLILPFKNAYAEFRIKKIKLGENCSNKIKTELRQLINNNGYSDEIVEE